MKALAYPVMLLAGAGVVLCFGFWLLGVSGIYLLPNNVQIFLFVGIFPIWLPTVLLMNRLTRDFKQREIWKAALRGCPPWMRTTLWIVAGCAFASFFVPAVFGREPRSSPQPFALFPVAFYAVSFCVMYSLLHVDEFDGSRRCLNGHRISPLAKFCEECGAPASADSQISRPS
jgi:hypothetical protein